MIVRRALASLAALGTVVALGGGLGAGCQPIGGARYSRKQAQKSLASLEKPGIVVGEFKITKVTDGDTIHVDGLDSSLRLLGIDAEETFKHEPEKREAEAGFEAYAIHARGNAGRPVKYATPMGMIAFDFAKQWFAGVEVVRIERDHPGEIRDRYDRYLAYVFAKKHGVWQNFNVELCRAGLAPYFDKYGRSRRFHDQFVAAEAEAKAAKRGLWGNGGGKYSDYPEREAWWHARGDFVAKFREAGEAQGKAEYIDLTHWDAVKELEAHVGKEVHVLATVEDIRIGDKGPARVSLSYRKNGGFPLIFFDRDVLGTTGLADYKGEYVVATGIPTVYENKHTHKKQLQIQIDSASQIELSPIPPPHYPNGQKPAPEPIEVGPIDPTAPAPAPAPGAAPPPD